MLDIYRIWGIVMLKQRIEPSESYDAIIEELIKQMKIAEEKIIDGLTFSE